MFPLLLTVNTWYSTYVSTEAEKIGLFFETLNRIIVGDYIIQGNYQELLNNMALSSAELVGLVVLVNRRKLN